MNRTAVPRLFAATSEPQVLGSAAHVITLRFLPSAHHPPPSRLPTLSLVGASPATDGAYQAVFLNFEDMVDQGLPPVFEVYLGVPPCTAPCDESYAGALPFSAHAALDITEVFTRLRSKPEWDQKHLQVLLKPRNAMRSTAALSIGRVSLYTEHRTP
ncbi:hypothetical protein ASD15_10725 [Massilia sp. Root351]|uniref:DUF7868 domain-containing protein n=1 Tax=Massilia sp. Root351 TaxID=1736522 RepID=UPI00070BCEAB|nr:hypothetical protein [Massilia sp. Root351]KQV82484.1 hypothetical protein ASD15_10725 [Massilia sp. Root351]